LTHTSTYKINDFQSLNDLFSIYLNENKLTQFVKSAIIGVAAPVIGDIIRFVNTDLSFSIKEIRSNFFPEGLQVLNDVQLQVYSLNRIPNDSLCAIGKKKNSLEGPKILIVPGTGLGLAALIDSKAIATEAGHITIPHCEDEVSELIDDYIKRKERKPTFEDIISGKGISYIYGFFSNNPDHSISNREILKKYKHDQYCQNTKELLLKILSIFTRQSALIWGSTGGVYLSGSLVKSLFQDINFDNFRGMFEDSETMKELLIRTPLYLIREENLAFLGSLEIVKNYYKK